MTYREELIKYLKNTFGNLDAEYSSETHIQSTLFSNAIELSKSNNRNERVLSIILYHQSSIEYMKQLIIYSNFLVKLLVYPYEMKFKKIKDDDSFATVLRAFENHVNFTGKSSLISKIRELNLLRNKISHHMFLEDFESFSILDTENINRLFEEIFEKVNSGFRDLINKIKKTKEKEELILLMR
jgi:hypothetical protein